MVDRFSGNTPNQDHTFYSMSRGEKKPMIYERNPDTGEIREYERTPEPEPYRNEAAEAIEILQRMERKLDILIEQKENK